MQVYVLTDRRKKYKSREGEIERETGRREREYEKGKERGQRVKEKDI